VAVPQQLLLEPQLELRRGPSPREACHKYETETETEMEIEIEREVSPLVC
jgi:hypothetical protein